MSDLWWWIAAVVAMLAVVFAVVAVLRARARRHGSLHEAFSHYVAPDVVEALGSAESEAELAEDVDRTMMGDIDVRAAAALLRTASRGEPGAPTEPHGNDSPKGEAARPPTVAAPAPEPEPPPTRFTVYHPQQLDPGEWTKLVAYVHVPDAAAEIAADSAKRVDPGAPVGVRSDDARTAVARNAAIRAVPELAGCRFNPPEQQVLWIKDWHALEFEVQASSECEGFVDGGAVNGRVTFYVESVIVAEVPIWALISTRSEIAAPPAPAPSTAEPYRAIFVSYAHDDAEVVESLGRSYKALGMKMLRDVEVLRSGEQWNDRLLDLIDEADIFQLYWSDAAGRSRYVEQEWRYALERRREHLIRPVYWQEPMPAPPLELGALHFARVEL